MHDYSWFDSTLWQDAKKSGNIHCNVQLLCSGFVFHLNWLLTLSNLNFILLSLSIRFNQVSIFIFHPYIRRKNHINLKRHRNGHISQLTKRKSSFFPLLFNRYSPPKSSHLSSLSLSFIQNVWIEQFWFIYFIFRFFISCLYIQKKNKNETTKKQAYPFAHCHVRVFSYYFAKKREIFKLIRICNSSSQVSWWIDLLNQINRNIYFANNSTKLWP